MGTVVLACGGDGETGSGPGAVGAAGTTGTAGSSAAGASGKGGTSGTSGKGGASGTSGKAGSGTGGSAAGDSGKGGGSGQSPAGAAGGPVGGCSADTDCPALATIPAGCAAPTCDKKTNKCVYASKDADGDNVPSGRCAALDGVTSIVIGEDCDDTNPDVFPGGWDGPAGEGHPNGCGDGLDQNCSGVDDDQKLTDGTTCTCAPGDTQDCSLDASGKPVVFPGGKPRGICAYGKQTCVDSGKWGPCVDTIAPNVEVCDPSSTSDEDCDGLIDDKDPDVLGQKTWFCDADSDSFLAPNVVGVVSCQQPPKDDCAGKWVTSGQKTDCDDDPKSGAGTYPGAKEICDGVRNDCDPTKQPDEGAIAVATWVRDDDGDGHVIAPNIGLPQKKIQCARPGTTAADCPAGKTTCTELWLKEGQGTSDDCDDGNADRFPGNWDGPATTQAGVSDEGFAIDFFQRTAASLTTRPDGKTTVPFLSGSDSIVSSLAAQPTIAFQWDNGRPLPALGYDFFLLRATATLHIVEAGDYVFYLDTMNDGGRLWVADTTGTPIIDDWVTPSGAGKRQATISLASGDHPLKLEYFEAQAIASLQLDWSGPSFARTVLRVKDPTAIGTKPSRCGDGVDHDCDGNANSARSLAPGSVRSCSMACEPGTMSRCDAPAGVQTNTGACRVGMRTCPTDGAAWGPCVDQINPLAQELCNGDNRDYNCNGVSNTPPSSDCACTTGAQRACNDASISGLGWCGNATCQNNSWSTSACYTHARICGSELDNDCDKVADNVLLPNDSWCKCSPGTVQTCPDRRDGFDAEGRCVSGKKTCRRMEGGPNAGSADFDACSGVLKSTLTETCQSKYDYNCDGKVGNAPGCVLRRYMLVPRSDWHCSSPAGYPTDFMISGDPNESGWSIAGHVDLWAAGDIAVNRCVCNGYHTVAVGADCPVACAYEGTVGWLASGTGPGKTQAYTMQFPGKPSLGLCSGLGCLAASCSAPPANKRDFAAVP